MVEPLQGLAPCRFAVVFGWPARRKRRCRSVTKPSTKSIAAWARTSGAVRSPGEQARIRPGQHGQRRKGKMSDFGTQLRAKQKLKGYYGSISEKQFAATMPKHPHAR